MSECLLVQNALTLMDIVIKPYSSNCCNSPQYRLKCNGNQQITELYWSGLGLSGNLTLNGLNSLTKVSLSGNTNLTGLNALCTFNRLTWVDVSGIPSPMTCFPSNIQNFYARNGQHTTLPNDCDRKLQVLDISGNSISKIPCSSWPLKRLYASKNALTSDTNMCQSSIEAVDLSYNKLEALSCTWSQARFIKLRNNKLDTISNFCGSSNLLVLDASLNKLKSVTSCIPNLQELSIEGNQITNVTDVLCSSSNLKFLNADNNQLTWIPDCAVYNNVELYGSGNSITYWPTKTLTAEITQVTTTLKKKGPNIQEQGESASHLLFNYILLVFLFF
eukprot:NODE_286_length_11757_cov_0.187768.p3 type:complete len:332 gc:universal NODE_286_length_11757_cov_0.187768:9828-10823(+)